MEWIYEKTTFESPAQFAHRKRYVQLLTRCRATRGSKGQFNKTSAKQQFFQHSKSMMNEKEQTIADEGGIAIHRTNPPLTPQGEACLVRYYEKDYKLLQRLLQNSPPISTAFLERQAQNLTSGASTTPTVGACKTVECRQGLQDILNRRQPLLSQSPTWTNITND